MQDPCWIKLRRWTNGGNEYIRIEGSQVIVDEAALQLFEAGDWSPWLWHIAE
jgi:hypothetical protein